MTRWTKMLLAAAALMALATTPAFAARSSKAPTKSQSAALMDIDRQIIVRFKAKSTGNERAQARRSAQVQFERRMRTGSQIVFANRAGDVDKAIEVLNRNPHVLYAERNARVEAFGLPNDTFFANPDNLGVNELWGMHNTGQELDAGGTQAGLTDKDIDAFEAWDRQTGSSEIVVAVVDEGVAYDHPDLNDNMWTNAAEASGTSGVDDDGNGEVDDVRGYDYIDFDTDPKDFGGHGTHVAGTIAAEGNNSLGVAGVVWDARIMPVRVLGGGGGSNEAVAAGFDYAARSGADVVNASLGGGAFSQEIANAVSAHPETLFVVAAGNGGNDGVGDNNDTTPTYPCNLTMANLICVAATGTSDELTSFSNFGAVSVDLAAPGEWILSSLAERTGSLFTDNFQSNLSNWTLTSPGDWVWASDGGNGAATDSSGAGNYGDNVSDIMTKTASLNLAGRTGCTMDMLLWTDIEPPYLSNGQPTLADALWVDTSTDGGTSWTPVALFYGSIHGAGALDYALIEQVDLKLDGSSNAKLRFRFESDSTNPVPYDGAWINGMQITCTGTYSPASYHYLDGTSMATPHVAGAAALLLSERPHLTVAQLRTALLTTGDELPSLSDQDKLDTGRRLNLNAALSSVELFPEVATDAATGVGETVATLNGTVNPSGIATSYEFEYGTSDAYGQKTPLVAAGSGTANVPASAALTGLAAATTFHYRIVAVRGSERFPGPDRTFTTLTPAPPPPPPPVTPTAPITPTVITRPPVVDPIGTMARTAKVSCKRRGSRRTCKVTATGAVKVAVSIKKGRRTLAKGSGRPGRTITLKGRLKRGRYRVTIVITDAKGNKATIKRTFRL